MQRDEQSREDLAPVVDRCSVETFKQSRGLTQGRCAMVRLHNVRLMSRGKERLDSRQTEPEHANVSKTSLTSGDVLILL